MASAVKAFLLEERNSITSATIALYSKAQNNESETANDMLITDLIFAQSKSVRTSTIILATFNVLAAFGTAASILYDCYWASKRCNPKFKASKFCVSSIHPAETLPLVLAIGIVIQGLIFAAVQGQGMDMLFTSGGCDLIAQYMFPALFIVPFIQAVFGLECAFRSLRKRPFQARGKYTVTICAVVILVMLIGTWVPTVVKKQPAKCFGSLLWFVTAYGTIGFVILSTLAGLMIVSGITIFVRLSSVSMVDQHQRIAASRVVYYLALGIVSLAFTIPYFTFLSITGKGDLKTAMMATVVVNLSGLTNGILHLILRSNTSTTSFGPKTGRHWARDKHEIRLWGPNELAFTNHLEDPVSGPQSPDSISPEMTRSESQIGLVGNEKSGMDSMYSPPFTCTNDASNDSRMPKYHSRKQSYSLFPVEATKSPSRQNDTLVSIYDISELEAPPKIQFGGKSHKRDSSLVSMATVQIGLRLSHAPDSEPPLPRPSTTYNPKNFSIMSKSSLLLPIAFGSPFAARKVESLTTLSPATFTPTPKQQDTTILSSATFIAPSKSKPSPTLQISTSPAESRSQTPELPLRSPRRPVPTPLITTALSPLPLNTPTNENTSPSVNKDLPPTPRAQLNPIVEAFRVSNTKLSPAVYSPSAESEKTAKSDKKMDFHIIAGLPSSPRCGKDRSPLASPTPSPLRTGNQRTLPSSPKKSGAEKKDWI